jgi:hypothetical protein
MKFFRFIPILAAAFGFNLPLHAELVDAIKAVVNNGVVTYAEVEEFAAPAAQALQREYAGQLDLFRQKLGDALSDGQEQLVERQLILHDFETEGYRLPDTVVDEMVQERIRKIPPGGARSIHRFRVARQKDCPGKNHHLALQG